MNGEAQGRNADLHERRMHAAMRVLWPSFLVATAAEGLFFSMMDPEDLSFFGHPLELSRLGAYTVGFFAFWAITAASSTFTCLLEGRRGADRG